MVALRAGVSPPAVRIPIRFMASDYFPSQARRKAISQIFSVFYYPCPLVRQSSLGDGGSVVKKSCLSCPNSTSSFLFSPPLQKTLRLGVFPLCVTSGPIRVHPWL